MLLDYVVIVVDNTTSFFLKTTLTTLPLGNNSSQRAERDYIIFLCARGVVRAQMLLDYVLISPEGSNDRFAYDNFNSYLALWLERSASFALLIRPYDNHCR